MEKLSLDWENCFGIKKIKQDFIFGKFKIQLIYAPNGVMKTSFAKTMRYLESNNSEDLPRDRLKNLQGKYSTRVDGSDIDKEVIYVINGESDIDSSGSFSNFLASKELKERYETLKNVIEIKKNAFITKLKTISQSSDCEQEILNTFSKNEKDNIFDVLGYLALELQKPTEIYEFKYNNIFDKKDAVKKFVEKYKNQLNEYISRYEELLSKSDFFAKKNNHNFGTYQATQLYQSVEDGNFFGVNHKIILQNQEEISSVQSLQEKITAEQEKILSDKALKKTFDTITKAIDKNAELRDFKSVIETHQDWIPEIINYEEFKKKVWLGFISKPEIKILFNEYLDVYNSNKDELHKIISDAGKQMDKWRNIIELYKARFHVPFNVSIDNQEDIILNEKAAKLKFTYYDDMGNEIETEKNKLDEILSRGERRAFIIMQFIFEMESRKAKNQETLLIMDDIAESFDYQNKYAIVEYIKDLSESKNFYSIILTHNYDFYRTVSSRLNVNGKNLWLVEKLPNHEIKFNGGEYTGNVFIKAFIEHSKESEIFISMLPFVRNLIEHTKGTESEEYKTLTNCLHIKERTRLITVKEVAEIMTEYTQGKGIKHEQTDDYFFDLVMNTADKIAAKSNINSIKLENKIVLSIAIRLLAEQYMYDAMIKAGKKEADFAVDSQQTGKWTAKFKKFCSNDTNTTIIDEVNVMTPEVIHLNSFMYEPLIDMSLHHLKKLYSKCKNLRNAGTE